MNLLFFRSIIFEQINHVDMYFTFNYGNAIIIVKNMHNYIQIFRYMRKL